MKNTMKMLTFVLILLAGMMIVPGALKNVEAKVANATFYIFPLGEGKVGSVTYDRREDGIYKNGKKILSTQTVGALGITTNGKTIYFTENKYDASVGHCLGSIYSVKADGTGKKLIYASKKHALNVLYYYSGKVIYTSDSEDSFKPGDYEIHTRTSRLYSYKIGTNPDTGWTQIGSEGAYPVMTYKNTLVVGYEGSKIYQNGSVPHMDKGAKFGVINLSNYKKWTFTNVNYPEDMQGTNIVPNKQFKWADIYRIGGSLYYTKLQDYYFCDWDDCEDAHPADAAKRRIQKVKVYKMTMTTGKASCLSGKKILNPYGYGGIYKWTSTYVAYKKADGKKYKFTYKTKKETRIK